MNEVKNKKFKTLKELNNCLIIELNKDQTFQYKLNVTKSYVVIRCTQCTKYQFWFRNKDKKDMISIFPEVNFDKNLKNIEFDEDKEIDVVFFRMINRKHQKCKHMTE